MKTIDKMNKNIFLSSTCFDLIDLRAELKHFIESIGFIPIMSDQLDCEFETFPDKNSIETCLINLRTCDTVIIILSQRYGGNLSKAGFGDYSATHLEYLEATKEHKRILFFVRDRLEADYIQFKKTNDISGLAWITEKDIKIFDILKNRRELANNNIDNWFWTFRDVIDIKSRLEIELKSEIKRFRLDKMIEIGNTPLLSITASASMYENDYDIFLNITIHNAGNQSAIDPVFLLFRANNYQQVLNEELHNDIGSYELRQIKPLEAAASEFISPIRVNILDQEYKIGYTKFVVEIMYKTIHGDLIADASEIRVRLYLRPNIDVITSYTSKRYINEKIYEKIISK